MTAKEFTILLDGWRNETLSQEEYHQFVAAVNSLQFDQLVDDTLEGHLDAGDLRGIVAVHDMEESLSALLKQINNQPVPLATVSTHRIHFLRRGWFRYAAAVIIMVTGAAIWYAQHNHSKSFNPLNHSSRQAAITPSHDRAILTLANGQQITLDSTQGNIIKRGDLTVVNLAGKLKYEGIGSTTEYNTISTPNGGQYQIALPDGSKVWLNAASSIKFPTAFKSNERNIEITGEAYMEIEKNSRQPFSVHVNGVKIDVLGTSFNVNAYSDETTIKTTLISGSVKVISNANEVILKPSQQAVVNTANENPGNPKIRLITVQTVQTTNTDQVLAWKNGIFQLDKMSLAEIMRQLARWYDIEVIYQTEVPDIQLEGKIKRNLTLSQMLDVLKRLGLKFRIEDRRMIVL